ncbi:DUF7266 family protein [Natrarchaeobius chitinivorans]|uniref:Uncharacterized protein n=1 Tax=Natrarchaeobius chitinivorans TaxID=1679083 RepID=A0A3N6LUW7_NATCH|nr:hypothetical protein [Natrarchaeobius chitinivorans]RQG92507.1 hypothetical protein EA473_15935 [Natrarchaeobius chitinivorans]
MKSVLAHDSRALSSAITHVLTMAMTTILIAGLFLSSGAMLETQTEMSADGSLETIGERLAGEITRADRLGSGGDTVTITTNHPRTVAGSSYSVELREDCDGPLLDGGTNCLYLATSVGGTEVFVPISDDVDIEAGSSATSGTIEIVHDGDSVGVR